MLGRGPSRKCGLEGEGTYIVFGIGEGDVGGCGCGCGRIAGRICTLIGSSWNKTLESRKDT